MRNQKKNHRFVPFRDRECISAAAERRSQSQRQDASPAHTREPMQRHRNTQPKHWRDRLSVSLSLLSLSLSLSLDFSFEFSQNTRLKYLHHVLDEHLHCLLKKITPVLEQVSHLVSCLQGLTNHLVKGVSTS